MSSRKVVILGGGLSGMAVAHVLAENGFRDVTVVERGAELGGLAGSFEREGHFYPLGYHHILAKDRTLREYLDLLGATPRIRWKRVRMVFHTGGRLYNLGWPTDFLAYPMSLAAKAAFVRLMLHAFAKSDWDDWLDRSAGELAEAWGSARLRSEFLDRLCELKFEREAGGVSGAWLGARLHFREGSSAFGYIPGENWTTVLCRGLDGVLRRLGVQVRTGATVSGLATREGAIREVQLDSGEVLAADLVVSSIPTEVLCRLLPVEETPEIARIRYSALLSVICASRRTLPDPFYWMNLFSRGYQAAGIFQLNALNPTIGEPGHSCVNFVTHLEGRHRPLFSVPDEDLVAGYLADFRRVFGFDLEPFWVNVARVPMYSPVFGPGYRNPPARSSTWSNLFFAGNYRTFPSIVSTGTALRSGRETAEVVRQAVAS